MNLRIVLFLGVFLSFGPGRAETLQWRNAGPGGGGWIQSIALDPQDPEKIHVGCDVGGYYQSADGGETFRILNEGLTDYFVQQILVHPENTEIIYLATQTGVFKSIDNGRIWKAMRSGFPPFKDTSHSAPVGALAMDPQNHDTLYAGIGRPRMKSGGRGLIYKSTNGGESWRMLEGIAGFAPDAVIHQLAIVPKDPGTILAATDRGIFKSIDGGISWKRLENGLPHRFCRTIVVHPGQQNVMFAVMWSTPGTTPWQGGVYRSNDDGETWAEINGNLPRKVAPAGDAPQKTTNYIRLAVDPRDPDRLFVGANSWWNAGLYATRDGGTNWELCTRRGENTNMDEGWLTSWGPTTKCLAISALRPDMIVYGDSGRVMRSDDGGAHWRGLFTKKEASGEWSGNGLEVTCLSEITVDPFHPQRLYCGYADIGFMISEDGGVSWRQANRGLPARGNVGRVVCDPDRENVAWCCEGKASIGKGSVAMTTDGGTSWTVVGSEKTGLPPGATRFLLLDPASPPDSRTLYVVVHGRGVHKSTDNGKSWIATNTGLGRDGAILQDLLLSPDNPQSLFAAVKADREDPTGGFYRTNNGGQQWMKVNKETELPGIRSLAIDPADPSLVFAACRRHYSHVLKKMFPGGVFRSRDGGITWEHVFKDRFAACVRVSHLESGTVYIGTTNHPYHDNATGRGVFVSRDQGTNWQPANNGLSVKQVSVITLDPKDPSRIYAGTGGNGLFIGEWR